MISDATKTIKTNLDFNTDPPQEGYIENEHENWSPSSLSEPEFRNNINAAKFNEIERLLYTITEVMGDVTTDFNEKTIGSKIRELEDKINTQGITSQLYYVLAQSGQGPLKGELYSRDTSQNIANGRFDISVKYNTYTTVIIDTGIAIIGNQENNARSIIELAQTELDLPSAPSFTIGQIPTIDPITWSNGETHHIDNSNTKIYLNHGYIKSQGLEVTDGQGGSEYVDVVAVDATNSSTWMTSSATTFSVDMTTGKITNLGGLTTGDWVFYYVHYGWRFDYIYIDIASSSIEFTSSNDIQNIQQINQTDIANISFAHNDSTKIPLYLIIVAPINNNTEANNVRCIGLQSSNKGCGYAKPLQIGINSIDIRRFIGSLGNGYKYMYGLLENPQVIKTDVINRQILELETDIPIPSTYDHTNNIVILPTLYDVNGEKLLSQRTMITPSLAASGYKLTEIYIEYPTGNIVKQENDDVPDLNSLVYSPLYFLNAKLNMMNIITDDSKIVKIIPGKLSHKFKPFVSGIAFKKAGEDLIIRHNLGNDYIAYAIPLTEPDIDPTTSLIHFTYICNPNVTIFKYNNTNDIYVMYTIVPTYNTKLDIPVTNNTIEHIHGDLKNNTIFYSIMDSNNNLNYGNDIHIEKNYEKNNIYVANVDTDMKIKSANIDTTYIDTLSNIDINGDSVGIPIQFNMLKNNGLLLQFTQTNNEPYWLEYNPISNSAYLKFKNTTTTSIEVMDIGNINIHNMR